MINRIKGINKELTKDDCLLFKRKHLWTGEFELHPPYTNQHLRTTTTL